MVGATRPSTAGAVVASPIRPSLVDVGRRKRPGNPRPPTVARRPPLVALAGGLVTAPLRAGPALDHHRHVRVVGVVRDETVVQVVRELGRDHAVDHRAGSTGRLAWTEITGG